MTASPIWSSTQLEDYGGSCKKGEGGAFARSGALRLDGVLPSNTSGGQLSEAHVEGMLQIVEGARQLQGVSRSDRQVPNAEIALISGHGGNPVLPFDADPREGLTLCLSTTNRYPSRPQNRRRIGMACVTASC